MAGQDLNDYSENKLIEHLLRNVLYTPPTTVYLALFTASPGESGDQTHEVTAGEYARQSITFAAASNGICLNSVDVQFPVAASDWGTITYLAILDAVTGGNMLFYGVATTPIHITATNVYKVIAGNLSAGLG